MAGQELPDRLLAWSEWLQGPLSKEVNSIQYKRDAFNSWTDIHDATNGFDGKGSMFRWWVTDNYIHALAMAIRRLSDKNPKTRSLMSLLLDIQQHRDVLTREWWDHKGIYRNTRFYRDKHQEYLRTFDLISSNGYVSHAHVQQYIDRLIEDSRAVKAFADKRIAHMDRNPNTPLSWEELHEPVDSVFEIYQHWHTEIAGSFPVKPLSSPWELVFTQKWITDEQAYEIAERRKREAGVLAHEHV